jgi:hypothetical protein
MTAHTVEAQTGEVSFLGMGFAGQTDFTVFSNQQWCTEQQ